MDDRWVFKFVEEDAFSRVVTFLQRMGVFEKCSDASTHLGIVIESDSCRVASVNMGPVQLVIRVMSERIFGHESVNVIRSCKETPRVEKRLFVFHVFFGVHQLFIWPVENLGAKQRLVVFLVHVLVKLGICFSQNDVVGVDEQKGFVASIVFHFFLAEFKRACEFELESGPWLSHGVDDEIEMGVDSFPQKVKGRFLFRGDGDNLHVSFFFNFFPKKKIYF